MKYYTAISPVLALVLCAGAHAEVRRVCVNGCVYSSAQKAIDEAKDGDIIELQAAYTFPEHLTVVGKRNITIRTSRWRELPPAGNRIDPERDAQLLATVQPTTAEPALDIGAQEHVVAQGGIDLVTNTITFEYLEPYSRFANGAEITCMEIPPSVLPKPLVAGERYFVRDWEPQPGGYYYKARLSKTKTGAPIDLTTAGGSGSSNYYERPRCVRYEQPTGIRVQGIRFGVGAGQTPRHVVRVGHNVEVDPLKMGPNVELRQVVIAGRPNDASGPLFCLAMFGGRDHSVIDSWIGHCKAEGDESKGLAIQNVVGANIQNNYIAAASINVLTAGNDAASMDVNKKIVLTGNFLEKPGYMMYKEGAGEPAGECYFGGGSGAFYRRTDVTPNTCSNGACYTCSAARQWQQDSEAYYRSNSYLNKNLLEFKDCEDCRVEGNLMRGSYAGPDTGQGWCAGISIIVTSPGTGGSPYHRANRVVFRNNWGDACYTGVLMSHANYGGAFAQIPMKDITVENNLFSNMGWYPAMSQFDNANTTLRFSLKQSTGVQGFRFANNTIRARADYGLGVSMFEGSYPVKAMTGYQFDNNLVSFTDYSFHMSAPVNACTADGLFAWIPNDGKEHFRNNVFFGGPAPNTFLNSDLCHPLVNANLAFEKTDADLQFVGAANHRLAAASKYSAQNPAASFVSFGTGADLGADVDMIEQYALPAEKGFPPMPAQLRLKIDAGVDSALLQFSRPAGVTCDVTLYSGPARIAANEHADTNTAARKRDDRTSSIVVGQQVYFFAGSVAPLSAKSTYWYKVNCGQLWAVGQFQTKAR